MKIIQTLCLIIVSVGSAFSQESAIMPRPAEINAVSQGTFSVTAKTAIVFDKQAEKSACYLADYCNEYYKLKLKAKLYAPARSDAGQIRLCYDESMASGQYTLRISAEGIRIQGSEDGLFYGVQSLIQLMPVSGNRGKEALELSYADIADQPRFVYRGMLLDVGRHFFSVDFLKKCINYAAWHKLNHFHLHLTDDQGWRIQIKKYPKLNEIGSWRNGTMTGLWPGTGNDSVRHGGFYTRQELKDLIDYARDRYITIIPEIEMPGHSMAALASYPYLGCSGGPYQVKETWGWAFDVFCAGKETTFEFLQDVLDEVIEIFPSEYIHIGGDECQKENWKKCPSCQARIMTEGLKDEFELQSYFIKRIEKYLNSKGRSIIGWDEILEGGIAPNAVVMSWRGDGEKGCLDAVHAGHKVILSPSYGFYLDYPQTSHEDSLAADWGGVTSLRKTYQYDPVNDKVQPGEIAFILGGQANVWTEYMNNSSKVEYMVFPRLSAVSEVLWSPKETRNWEQFKKRMELQYKRYQLWGIHYNPANPDAE